MSRRPPRSATPSPAMVADVITGIRTLDRGLRLAARTVERETGLSAAQLFALQHLDGDEALALNELARRTLTDRSSVSVVVDRLLEAGLATRSPDPADRRRAQVRITARGRKVLARAPLAPTDLLLNALSRMPADVVRDLGTSLTGLNAALGFTESEMLFGTR